MIRELARRVRGMSVAQHGAISFLLVTGSRRGDAMLPNLLGEKKAPSVDFHINHRCRLWSPGHPVNLVAPSRCTTLAGADFST